MTSSNQPTSLLADTIEGNQRNGEGNLSLYVEMLDELQSGVGVTAELSFYIYNFHTRDYLRIRAEERTRFSTIKRKCGLHKAISLEDFTDPRNGFLVDDCCILGTEITIVNLDNEAFMTMIKDVTPTHTWVIQNFSTRLFPLNSSVFCIGKHRWYLVAYPKGHKSQQNESLSLYLCLADREAVERGQKLYVEFELRLMDNLSGDHLTRTLSRCFSGELGVEWGFSDFVSLTYLGDFSKYVRQNVVTIEVKFTSMVVLNNSS